MISEFQVLHIPAGAPEGTPLQSILIRAETPPEARALAEEAGCQVKAVGPGLPVIDWKQPTWSVAEAAVYLKCRGRALSELASAGLLPKARGGKKPIFRTEDLEALIRARMEPAQE